MFQEKKAYGGQSLANQGDDDEKTSLLSGGQSLPQSHAASLRGTSIAQRGRHFVDDQGRVLNLRGFNVSAANKLVSTIEPRAETCALI